ncbi:MAG: MFS transporter [Trueperaceae bacterium]
MSEAVTTVTADSPRALPLRAVLLGGLSTRLLVDTANQLFNPFLAVFAAGLGTSVVTMGALVSVRSIVGITGPVLGAWSDRIGYMAMMRVGLLSVAAGLLLFGISPSVWLAALAMLPMGVGIAIFTPSLQAYASERLTYATRARGLGILEYAWALAGIVGLSLAGLVIAGVGWRAPFPILALLLFLAFLLSLRLPPVITPARSELGRSQGAPASLRSFFDLGPTARSAWSSIAIVGLSFFGMMNVIIIHGAWLQGAFGLSVTQLGGLALLLGLADLAGSSLVSLVGDIFGKRRGVLAGVSLCLVGYLALPLVVGSALSAVVALAVLRFLMQVAYVSNVPLLSEQVPRQRGKVMAFGLATGQVGMAAAGLTGPWAYLTFGVSGLGIISAAAMVVALIITIVWLREVPQVPAATGGSV